MTAPIRLGSHPTVLMVLLTCLQKLLPKLKKRSVAALHCWCLRERGFLWISPVPNVEI